MNNQTSIQKIWKTTKHKKKKKNANKKAGSLQKQSPIQQNKT